MKKFCVGRPAVVNDNESHSSPTRAPPSLTRASPRTNPNHPTDSRLLRDISLKENLPPLYYSGSHSSRAPPVSLFVAVAEAEITHPSHFICDPLANRRSYFVACNNLANEYCVSYTVFPHGRRPGGAPPHGVTVKRWRVYDMDHWVKSKSPPAQLDHGLLALDFVGWVPEDWIVTMGREFQSGYTFETPPVVVDAAGHGAERYDSREWVREQLGKLVAKGVIGELEMVAALARQRVALEKPFMGYFPNAPVKAKPRVQGRKRVGCLAASKTRS